MKRKKLLFLLATTVVSVSLNAQDLDTIKHWKKSFQTGINFNQSAFSNSWKAGGGGTNNLAGRLFFSGNANYKKDKISWDNVAQLDYGRQLTKKKDYTSDVINGKDTTLNIKIADRIFAESKVGYALNSKLNIYGSAAFLSQIDKGLDERNNIISYFMSPGYLTESFGFDYKPESNLSISLGLLTLRQTFLNDTNVYLILPANYGVKKGKSFRNEIGTQVVVDYNKKIYLSADDKIKDNAIILKARYWAFVNYQALGNLYPNSTAKAGVKAIDQRLDLSLSAKLNKYMNVSFGYTMFYDLDQDVRVQHAQNFALGIMYNFSK